jgi:hypothetical protein
MLNRRLPHLLAFEGSAASRTSTMSCFGIPAATVALMISVFVALIGFVLPKSILVYRNRFLILPVIGPH